MTEQQPLSPREISRLITSVDNLAVTIETLRSEMAATYVRKDVYEADRKADEAEGVALSGRVGKMEGYWGRLAWTIGLMVLTALVSLVLVQQGGVAGGIGK